MSQQRGLGQEFLPRVRSVATLYVVAVLCGTLGITQSSAHEESPTPSGSSLALADCSGGNGIIAYGNFECGTPYERSPWVGEVGAKRLDSFERLDDIDSRQGNYAGRFTLRPGDTGPDERERAELQQLGPNMGSGDDAYYAFSVRFPASWPGCSDGFCLVSQWQSWNGGGPNLTLHAPSDTHRNLELKHLAGVCASAKDCEHEAVYPVLSASDFENALDRWIDVLVHVRWSIDNGNVQIWHRVQGEGEFTEHELNADGDPTLKKIEGDILEIRSKIGLYRRAQDVTHVVDFDSYCIADTLQAARTCLP